MNSRALLGHPSYALSCVLRAGVVWGGIRLMVWGASRLGRLSSSGDSPDLRTSLLLTAIVCAVVLIDAKATRELTYLRNLGLPARWLVALSAAVVLALEALFHLVA